METLKNKTYEEYQKERLEDARGRAIQYLILALKHIRDDEPENARCMVSNAIHELED